MSGFVRKLTPGTKPQAYRQPMTAKYYTQFILTDQSYQGRNEFSGVIELNQPLDDIEDRRDIEALLARNFDLNRAAVQLVSWSRLH